jgi:uncharacterized membrane protein YphA (DoxX/SURF4 family)
MLSLFPIQFLAPLAYFLLRVCAGLIFVRFGFNHFRFARTRRFFFIIGSVELALGLFLLLGLYAQFAALFGAVLSLIQTKFFLPFSYPEYPQRLVFVLLFVISLSLVITGAGVFAVDLPL